MQRLALAPRELYMAYTLCQEKQNRLSAQCGFFDGPALTVTNGRKRLLVGCFFFYPWIVRYLITTLAPFHFFFYHLFPIMRFPRQALLAALPVAVIAHGDRQHHPRQNPSSTTSYTFKLAATNPTAVPLSAINSLQSSSATKALHSTAVGGSVPTFISGAPPLPASKHRRSIKHYMS